MTITDPTETVADGDPLELEPELCWLNLADMAPPSNRAPCFPPTTMAST